MKLTMGICVTLIIGSTVQAQGKKGSIHTKTTTGENKKYIVGKIGEKRYLTCTKGIFIKFCMFSEPRTEQFINLDNETLGLFSEDVTPVVINPKENTCGIYIPKLKKAHQGTWKCQALVKGQNPKGYGKRWFNQSMKEIKKVFEVRIIQENLPNESKMIPEITTQNKNSTKQSSDISENMKYLACLVIAIIIIFTCIATDVSIYLCVAKEN